MAMGAPWSISTLTHLVHPERHASISGVSPLPSQAFINLLIKPSPAARSRASTASGLRAAQAKCSGVQKNSESLEVRSALALMRMFTTSTDSFPKRRLQAR